MFGTKFACVGYNMYYQGSNHLPTTTMNVHLHDCRIAWNVVTATCATTSSSLEPHRAVHQTSPGKSESLPKSSWRSSWPWWLSSSHKKKQKRTTKNFFFHFTKFKNFIFICNSIYNYITVTGKFWFCCFWWFQFWTYYIWIVSSGLLQCSIQFYGLLAHCSRLAEDVRLDGPGQISSSTFWHLLKLSQWTVYYFRIKNKFKKKLGNNCIPFRLALVTCAVAANTKPRRFLFDFLIHGLWLRI